MKFYMAYGSNLNKVQMSVRCPEAIPVGTSELKDFELVFRRGVLTIEPKKGSVVPVGVWLVSEEDEANLDVYEGWPTFYRKETMMIDLKNDQNEVMEVEGFVYIMNHGKLISTPSSYYYMTCFTGYNDFGFDTSILKDAERRAREEMFRRGESMHKYVGRN